MIPRLPIFRKKDHKKVIQIFVIFFSTGDKFMLLIY